MKYTNGPWTVENDCGARRVIKGKNGNAIVIVEDWTKPVDASLIAAAPELFAALVNLLRETDEGTQLCAREFADAAKVAIAKTEAGYK